MTITDTAFYAKKGNNLYQFEWTEDNRLLVELNGVMTEQNENDYIIVQIGFLAA